jgi:hypothetical protein
MTFTIYNADMAPSTADEMVLDTTLAFLPTAAVPVDKLAVLPVVWDNPTTPDADDTTILSVSDSKGNTWLRAGEAQYSPGIALDGILAGIFYSVITTQIETTDTITITSTDPGTAKGCTLASFNRDTAKVVGVAGRGYQRVAASNAYTVTVGGLANEEHLWVGLNGMEADSGSTNGADTTYTIINQGGVGSFGPTGGSATNVGGRSAYKISTGTTETYDRATLSTQDRCTVLVAFNESVGGGGGVVLDPFGMSGFFGG